MIRKAFVPGTLRAALGLSLAIHLLFLGVLSRWTRADVTPDLDSLALAPVSAYRPSPPPPAPLSPVPPPKADVRPTAPSRIRTKRRGITEQNQPRRRAAPGIRPSSASTVTKPRLTRPARGPHATSTLGSAARDGERAPLATGKGTPPGVSPGDSEEIEETPEGPIDLQPRGGETDAARLTDLTKGAMVRANTKVPNEINTVFVRQATFSGPGALYSTEFDVPASTPPGTVYRLEIVEVVLSDENAKEIPFTAQNGTLTVVPTRAPLPPVSQPALSGAVLGVGNLYAHRGTTVTVEMFAGDGIRDVMGLQAKVKVSVTRAAPRKKREAPAGSNDRKAALSPRREGARSPETKDTKPVLPANPSLSPPTNPSPSASGDPPPVSEPALSGSP